MKDIKEKIAVMQAFADGKKIETKSFERNYWADTLIPVWNWHCFDYRVKAEEPRTWEEFCEQNKETEDEYYVSGLGCMTQSNTLPRSMWTAAVKTKEDIEGLLALIKIKRLRDVWVGDWQPNWTDDTPKFRVCENNHNGIVTAECCFVTERCNLLTFPTREMAQDFIACFEDLIKQAKMWL